MKMKVCTLLSAENAKMSTSGRVIALALRSSLHGAINVYRTFISPGPDHIGITGFSFTTTSKDVHLFFGKIISLIVWHSLCQLLEEEFCNGAYNEILVSRDEERTKSWHVVRTKSSSGVITYTWSPAH
jgi:hypothetical protein